MTKLKAPPVKLEELKPHLRFSRTGQFYKLSRSLTHAEHNGIVEAVVVKNIDPAVVALSGLGASERREVRSSTLGSGNVSNVEVFGTLVVQPLLQEASIASAAGGLKELRFAHMLLLEGAVQIGSNHGQRYAFISRDGLDSPFEGDNLKVITKLTRAEMLNPFLSSSITNADAGRIEEISMRMMNVSRIGLRRKVVEAYDVESSVSSLGLHRSIPGTMRVRLPRSAGVGTAVTISTGRHSVRAGSTRVKLSTVVDWFAQCVLRMDAENGKALQNGFLKEMAEPLTSLDGLDPGSLLLDYSVLDEVGLGADGLEWKTTIATPKSWTSVSTMLEAFDDPVPLIPSVRKPPRSGCRVFEGSLQVAGGSSVIVEVEVENALCRLAVKRIGALGKYVENGKDIHFEQLINRESALRIAFAGGQVLYASEGAHRSGNLQLAVRRLLSSVTGVKSLQKVVSEKGDVTPADIKFQPDSCFDVIESDTVLCSGDTLVCGDANDEVFDYLDIDLAKKRLRWLHAKVLKSKNKTTGAAIAVGSRAGSLSASALQEVVGQAIKNLAFLRRETSDPTFAAEVATWSGICTLPKPARIARLRKGSQPDLKVMTILHSELAQHEVAIVVPSYSKKLLERELPLILSGGASQYTIQLFWLLSSFTHACLEVGATPLIFMRE
jgi:hypothetical protein